MSSPAVSRISVEYVDGSCDTIDLLYGGELPLYSFTRRRSNFEPTGGAYTTSAIAALLSRTAYTTKWTEYSAQDPNMVGLIRSWLGERQTHVG